MKLKFVKYDSIYLKSCTKLVNETWPLDDELVNASQPHHLFNYYIRNCVYNSIYTDLIVNEETEEVLGILFGSDENHSTWKSSIKNFKNKLTLFKHIICGHLGKRFVAIQSIKDISNIDKNIEKYCNKFDSQLNLFLLSQQLQRQGYGRILMDRYILFCKNQHQMKKIFLWTDISCNRGFYEHYGFKIFKQFYDDRLTDHHDKRTDKPNGFIYINDLIDN